MAREVGTEGRLGGQAEVPGVAGTWKDLTDNVNLLTGNLTVQLRDVSKVATAIANGDLGAEDHGGRQRRNSADRGNHQHDGGPVERVRRRGDARRPRSRHGGRWAVRPTCAAWPVRGRTSPTPSTRWPDPPDGGHYKGADPPDGGHYKGADPPEGGHYKGAGPPEGGDYEGCGPPEDGHSEGSRALLKTGATGIRASESRRTGLTAGESPAGDGPVERFLRPEPRVRLGVLLGRNRAATACMDLSDGLADGLRGLARASGTGLSVDADALPLDREAHAWFEARGRDPVLEAVAGGDDYELLFTVSPRRQRRLRAVARLARGLTLTRIGVVTRDGALVLRRHGRDEELPASFAHFGGGGKGGG